MSESCYHMLAAHRPVWNDFSAHSPLPKREVRAPQKSPLPRAAALVGGGREDQVSPSQQDTVQDLRAGEAAQRQLYLVLWKVVAVASF